MSVPHTHARRVWLRTLCSLIVLSACADAPEHSAHPDSQEAEQQPTAAARPAQPAAENIAGSQEPARSPVAAAGGGSGGDVSAAKPADMHSLMSAGKGGGPSPAGVTGSAGTAGMAVMASAGAGGSADATGPEPASCKRTSADAATPTVFVIGDSTASIYEDKLYPRMGWAQPLQDYFKPACAKVQDKALSGRSSKSFLEEGAWAPIKSALRAGDFVLIQFGHNDEKREDPERFTEPFDSFQRYLSTYVDDTLAAGATPILLTPIERNNWSNGMLKSTHGEYPAATRALGEMRTLSVVDMTQLTRAYFERLGQPASTKLFLNLAAGESPNYPNGNMDNTHLHDKGAHAVAELALAELTRQRTPLAALLDHVPMP